VHAPRSVLGPPSSAAGCGLALVRSAELNGAAAVLDQPAAMPAAFVQELVDRDRSPIVGAARQPDVPDCRNQHPPFAP
jgi:hypothetical protein